MFSKGLVLGSVLLIFLGSLTQIVTSNRYVFDNSASYDIEIINDYRNIMLTGYWNPTGQMIAEFSTDSYLNPDGWKGENWEDLGYDIYSFFPTPYTYNGTFEVDYQNTWEDFWDITADINPIAIISFGAGNGPWEIEFNARNLDSWVSDNNPPYQPTPCPPDDSKPAGYVRHSTLPVQAIADAVNDQTDVYAWVDWSGNPGAYLCEYIAYLGMWYQDIHNDTSDPFRCWQAGFIHVVSSLPLEDAKEATMVTIREVIKSLPDNPPTVPVIYEDNGSFFICSIDPEDSNIKYFVDWDDGTTTETDWYLSGQIVEISHSWSEPGVYQIRAKAMDTLGAESDWSEPFNVSNINPPDAPVIDGPARGKAETSYSYTFNLSDPDGDDIAEFTVKWGDSPDETIVGPFASGSSEIANHTWNSQRTYTIKAKAKDIYGAESEWGEFEVIIPRTQATFNSFIQWFLERFPILERLLGLIRVI
jgi:pyrrolidone-carboxylate peptidase